MLPWSTGQLVNRSSVGKLQGHAHRTVNATGTKLVQPQAGSAVRHLHCIICNPLFGKEAENKTQGVTLLELTGLKVIWGKSSTRNRGAGKYFLSGRSVCHSGPEMLPFVKGRVRRDIIFFRSQECEAMTNKSHLMQCKDKKKTVSQVISSTEPGSRIHASLRAWLAGSEQPHRL